MAVVWLASYPRSGNTWLRFLLYNYLHGEVVESDDVNRRIPDIHKLALEEVVDRGELTLYKTHLAAGPNHPLIQRTRGFIYVLCHPRDVLISALNFMRMTGQFSGDDRTYAERFIQTMGEPAWTRLGYANWLGHVASWLAAAHNFPHAFLRYERLKADPMTELSAALRVLDMEVDEARLARAIEGASFERMRGLEDKESKAGDQSAVFSLRGGEDRALRHVRQGKTGQSLEPLGEGLDEVFDRRFEMILSLLGYPL
ncbi:MAG: sulfotransferase domain-containing protein [Leptospirillia bacterium]